MPNEIELALLARAEAVFAAAAAASLPKHNRAHVLGARFHVQMSRVAAKPGVRHAHELERVVHLVGQRHCKGVSGEIIVDRSATRPEHEACGAGIQQVEGGARSIGVRRHRAVIQTSRGEGPP